MATREEIGEQFKLFAGGTGGIDNWLTESTPEETFDRLNNIERDPLSCAQLNQLLILSHEAGVSDGFFKYYWLSVPITHPYDVKSIEGYRDLKPSEKGIQTLDQLRWGLYRLYVDALLFYGNIRSAFRSLRTKSEEDLITYFKSKQFDNEKMRARGTPIPLREIPQDDRYLISEMACKSWAPIAGNTCEIKNVLNEAYRDHLDRGGGPVTPLKLLTGSFVENTYKDSQAQFMFSADDILDITIKNQEELDVNLNRIINKFTKAREAALANTRYYLSMVDDLDVYVATSMRKRQEFRNMANTCDTLFSNDRIKDLKIRYFDPTLSATDGHEDKGLIECLMVKCAKTLVYFAGEKESYGKDAEAAMALSLGKPVIFFCGSEQRSRFYRDVHPLSKLIHFDTGVAVGALVTDQLNEVAELLQRIFENKMEYEIELRTSGYYRLKDRLTGSVVRLQTNNALLRETFWNYYHNKP